MHGQKNEMKWCMHEKGNQMMYAQKRKWNDVCMKKRKEMTFSQNKGNKMMFAQKWCTQGNEKMNAREMEMFWVSFKSQLIVE